MTTNKQIIIDGVDVSRCKFFNDITESYYCFGIPCKDRPNCYFKQLARKTQECEELKKKFSKFFNIDNQECWDIAFLKDENARYKQALDEIEENCLKAQDPCQED